MKRVGLALLDFFFPPHCIYCDRIVDSSAHTICKKCETDMPWIADDEPLVKGKYFTHCAAAAWYLGEVREAFRAYKFRGRTEHARMFGNALARSIRLHFAERYDLLTWLPVSPERRRERGYDQSFLLAEATAKVLEVPLTSTLAKLHTKAQSSLDGAQTRRKNVQDAFEVPKPFLVAGKRVLLIDDLITTGSTLEAAAETLLQAGASEVLCACFARTSYQKENFAPE